MKKRILTVMIVALLVATILLTVACDSNTASSARSNTNAVETCEHDFFNGVCLLCGAYDGVSAPSVEVIDEYCDKYLQNIRAESYPNFAETYDFDFEKDPELIDQGMFWTWYDESVNVVREVSARDHDEVDKMIADGRIDGNKPTIIFVHGVCVSQYSRTIVEVNDEAIEIPSDGYGTLTSKVVLDPTLDEFKNYTDYTGRVNLNLIYLKNGYNVVNFVYVRFADETSVTVNEMCDDGIVRSVTYANNATIEQKVYSTDGACGMRYRKSDGVFSDGTDAYGNVVQDAEVHEDVKFCVAEYFAAEYVRLVNYMVEKNIFNENSHIGLTGHSMGGVVSTIGSFLLTELVRVNQIPAYYVPDRIALEDSYFGVYPDYCEVVPTYSGIAEAIRAEGGSDKDIELKQRELKTTFMMFVYGIDVHWTGKKINGGGTPPLYLTALRQLVRDYDIAVEYYVDESPVGKGGMAYASITAPTINMLIREYTSTIAYVFKFKESFLSHNGVREEHCASFLYPVYLDVDGNKTVSAASTDDEIKAARGKQWYVYEGNSTSTLSDDVVKTYEGKDTPPVSGK